jgi:hypothetical protein
MTDNIILEDEEYLDEKFPKGIFYRGVKKPESELRGEAMVLMALSRKVGEQEALKEELTFLKKICKTLNSDYREIKNRIKLLDSKLKYV